ncbi:MAG TPA: phosphoglucosamine mutase [Holosporales bacterium]|nr:phosphoglucosamine mutase [Holosporales bacterium]HBW25250.1 phosphoglucosamine mutase [Holosporales bacterium]HCE95157.1 phosphoglucosamine mutase [Holosporales bacterium]
MERKYFGTDGIRGQANREPLTPQTLARLGQAIGLHFMRGNHRHRVVIGKDTRLSGYMVESALASGFVSVGMDVATVGPMPTPAVAMLTRSMRADLGVMISASHNLFSDNGIKLFDPDGFKLSDGVEKEIENRLEGPLVLAAPPSLGQMVHLDDAIGRYVEFVKGSLPRHTQFDGLRIVVDCANGAAYKAAPLVLKELGATVIPLAIFPNGQNINDTCGATAPQKMCAAVRQEKAHVGLAFDGDADRVVFADEKGTLVDGDQIMALMATYWQDEGLLQGKGVVATHMSNLGFERYLNLRGLNLIRTPIGDRYVIEAMRDTGCNLGGESSGHVILSDYATSGDGLLTALQVLLVLKLKQQEASKMLNVFKALPQVLKNVKLSPLLLELAEAQTAIELARKKLENTGRLLVRPSGTEALIRIMAEAEDETFARDVVDSIAQTLTDLSKENVA